jgi:hypothetical protein
MENLVLYYKLSTRSQRSMRRVRKRYGHPHEYNPSYRLVARLVAETGMSEDFIRNRLQEERKFLLSYRQYY